MPAFFLWDAVPHSLIKHETSAVNVLQYVAAQVGEMGAKVHVGRPNPCCIEQSLMRISISRELRAFS